MSFGIPAPTSLVRRWSGIMGDICAMVLLWKKASTMICSWKKGTSDILPSLLMFLKNCCKNELFCLSEVV